MSPGRAPGTRPGGRHVFLIVLGCLLVALALTTWKQGPRVVRQVWGRVGMRQVEGHAETIRLAAAESRIDPCLLAGLMYAESRGQVDAVSNKGALGLFQLMESSAGDAARRLKLPAPSKEQLLNDPVLNTRLAASHLAWLIRHNGPDLERVLVAYNAGRGKLARWEEAAGGWQAWRAQRIAAGDSDALTYAQQVLEFAERFRAHGVIVAQAERAPDAVEAAPRTAAKRARERTR